VPDPGRELDLLPPRGSPPYLWSAFLLRSGDVLTRPCKSLDAAVAAARAALPGGAVPPDLRICRHGRGHDGTLVFRPDGRRDPGTWRLVLRRYPRSPIVTVASAEKLPEPPILNLSPQAGGTTPRRRRRITPGNFCAR